MLRAHRRRLPHAWVAGDDEMGRPGWFRASLMGMCEQYLLGAPANTSVRDLEGRASRRRGSRRRPKRRLEQLEAWVAHRPAGAWTEVEARQGEKGPIVVECLKRRVQAHTDAGRIGPEELLFVTRERTGQIVKHDYCLSNAPADTPLAELARAAKAEHRIEECLQRAKGEAGLSDYPEGPLLRMSGPAGEVRTWRGWHHHQALALMAVWFLTRHTSWGKTADAGDHGPAGQDGDHVAAA